MYKQYSRVPILRYLHITKLFYRLGEQHLCNVRLILSEEKDFHHLHDSIIRNSSSLNKTSTWSNAKLTIKVKFDIGDLSSQEHQRMYQDAVEAKKIGFPSAIGPGVVR